MNGAVPFTAADFPGLDEAVAHERYLRSAACLGLNEVICGVEVKPLCSMHVAILRFIHSPFLSNLTADQILEKPYLTYDIMRFLWVVSPMYKQGSQATRHWWQRRTPRDKFNKVFSKFMAIPPAIIVQEILDYVNDAFFDADDSEEERASKSFYADEVSIAYELSRCGFRLDFWAPECPRDKNPLLVPLKLVFQIRRARLHYKCGDEAGLTNKSDKFIAAALPDIAERHRNSRN